MIHALFPNLPAGGVTGANSARAIFVNRRAVEDCIEFLIAALDTADGDVEMEDGDQDCCAAHDDCLGQAYFLCGAGDGLAGDPDDAEDDDPGGGDVVDEPHDRHENLKPIYAVDQSTGPVNERQAVLEWYNRQAQNAWR